MLNITRTWNAVCAVGGMQRGIALARDYARRRVAFGAPLADKPLHVETLADLVAEYEAAFALTFHEVLLLGKSEAGEATPNELAVLERPPAAHEAPHGQDGRRERQRGARVLRGCGVRRGHRPARAPARRAGASDLGGHDERARARDAPGPRARGRLGARARARA